MEPQEIKDLIIQEISRTEKQINQYEEMAQPISPDVAIGRISRMDAINNKSITESAIRQANEKLSKLKIALTKVGTDSFGICLKCHQPIPVGRIVLKPESPYCVNCAR